MKNWQITLAFFAVVLMLFAGLIQPATAGVIHHKIKIKNETDRNAEVWVDYAGSKLKGAKSKTGNVGPGASITFDIGAHCAWAVGAWVDGVAGFDVYRCTIGPEGNPLLCTRTCWGSDWTLRKHSDGTYHFDRE